MSSSLSRVSILTTSLSIAFVLGCGLATRSTISPNTAVSQAPSNVLPHEVFVSSAGTSRSSLSVLYPPPAPVPEQLSENKPSGDDVVWVPGYWTWDVTQDNWLWIKGVWVHAPAGRQWTPGYWSVASDGWRWVPGYWAIVAPPPPPPATTYTANLGCFDDPGFGLFAGYGFWWPWYGMRPYHDRCHNHEPPPHSPGPHMTEVPPAVVPALASNIHETAPKPQHLDMNAILASMPAPLASSLNPHGEHGAFAPHAAVNGHGNFGAAALHHDSEGRLASLFLNPHLETTLHEHLTAHEGGERGHESGSHASGGHGGGHGR